MRPLAFVLAALPLLTKAAPVSTTSPYSFADTFAVHDPQVEDELLKEFSDNDFLASNLHSKSHDVGRLSESDGSTGTPYAFSDYTSSDEALSGNIPFSDEPFSSDSQSTEPSEADMELIDQELPKHFDLSDMQVPASQYTYGDEMISEGSGSMEDANSAFKRFRE